MFLYIELDNSINVPNKAGDTPLHEACMHGRLTIVKELMTYVKRVDPRNDSNETPLHMACKEGFVEIVEKILNHVQSEERVKLIEAQDSASNTPMHFAVERGDIDMVKVFLTCNVNCSIKNSVEAMPIHIAAEQGHKEIADELLREDRFCLDQLDIRLRSPLHYAAAANQEAMIKFLIRMKVPY